MQFDLLKIDDLQAYNMLRFFIMSTVVTRNPYMSLPWSEEIT